MAMARTVVLLKPGGEHTDQDTQPRQLFFVHGLHRVSLRLGHGPHHTVRFAVQYQHRLPYPKYGGRLYSNIPGGPIRSFLGPL